MSTFRPKHVRRIIDRELRHHHSDMHALLTGVIDNTKLQNEDNIVRILSNVFEMLYLYSYITEPLLDTACYL